MRSSGSVVEVSNRPDAESRLATKSVQYWLVFSTLDSLLQATSSKATERVPILYLMESFPCYWGYTFFMRCFNAGMACW